MSMTLIKAILLCTELIPKVISIGEKVESELKGDAGVEAKVKDALEGLLDVVTDIVSKL